MEKITTNFEDSALHLKDKEAWKALKPKPEQWLAARQIVQHCDLTMRKCCHADLLLAEFNELEKAILYGDAMDTQIVSVIGRVPKTFHVGMIPDMRTDFAEGAADHEAQEQIEAEHAKWVAELRLFKAALSIDQRLIRRTELGSQALQDILEWNDADHVCAQGLVGKSLVKQFMETRMPKAVAKSWAEVPGAVAAKVQLLHRKDGPPKIIHALSPFSDFNTPNSRDALKINEVAMAMANLFNNCGPDRCVLLAFYKYKNLKKRNNTEIK